MSRIKEFTDGVGYIRKGFRFFSNHKDLWWYSVIPTMINIIVLAVMFFLLFHFWGNLTGFIFGNGAEKELATAGFFHKVLGGLLTGLFFIAKVIIFIILLLLILIATFVFSMILAGPFNDALSEKVERILKESVEQEYSERSRRGGRSYRYWSELIRSLWRTIITELGKTAFFLAIPILLLVLNLLPVFGSLLCLLITGAFAAFDIGFNFFDYPMSRRLWTFRKRIRLGWQHRYYITGFGLISLIPLFPFIFSAPLVAGGTILFIDLNEEPPSPYWGEGRGEGEC